MENIIIIVIAVLVLGVSVYLSVKHFKGEGGCCGGVTYKPKKKKLKNVLYKKEFKVDGMHCEHCRARVEEAVNDISGICGKVDLGKGTLTVSYSKDVDDSIIVSRLERAGYKAK